MSAEEEGVQSWLRAIREWPLPKKLFDWDEVIDALEEATIGIAKYRYTKWRDALPKRPLTPSGDDSEPGSVGQPSGRAVSRKRTQAEVSNCDLTFSKLAVFILNTHL